MPDEGRGGRGPLHGVRVVELAGLGPGPFAAMVLADLGAEVLRVDRPSRQPIAPDATRPDAPATDGPVTDTPVTDGPATDGPATDGPAAGGAGAPGAPEPRANPYDVMNRSRRRVAVDLRHEEGAGLVADLVARADVLIEGFRPGVTERWGLGPEECRARNPTLVYGRMTGWGQEGPMAGRAGHDLNYLAMAGVLAHVGREGQPPTPPLNLVADFGGGGMLLVVGILAALVERSASGRGQVVDAAMVDGAALLMAPLFGAWASGFWGRARGTNLLDSGAPFYDAYRCADGEWVAVGAIEPQFFAELLDGLGLAGDPTVPEQHDQQAWPELRRRLAERFATRPRQHWSKVFEGRDACVSPVLDMGEATEHPAAVARGAFVDVDGVMQPAPAPRFSRTPPAAPTAALDADDPTDVLAGWGIDRARIDGLARLGVLS